MTPRAHGLGTMAQRWARRRTWPAAIALGLVAATVAMPAPASASVAPGDVLWFASRTTSQVTAIVGDRRATIDAIPAQQVLAGHFDGNSVFLYSPGPAPDGLVSLTDDGGSLAATFTRSHVTDTYVPIVADLDGNGHDDIFWYGRNATADYIWLFQDGGSHVSLHAGVNGSYVPIPFRVASGGGTRAAILWYRPGPGADHLWIFEPDGSHHDATGAVRIDGLYRPVVGHFTAGPAGAGHDQILWADPTGRRTSLWAFAPEGATHVATKLPASPSGARPAAVAIVGFSQDIVYWYRPGPATERLWIWGDGAVSSGTTTNVSGTYATVVDGQGRAPIDGMVFVGPGASAKGLQLNPESAPLYGTFTAIPDLPPDPIGAVAIYLAPV
jgi:hypothetical protein